MSGELVRCLWCNHEVECLQRSGACFVYCDNCGCSGPRESTVDSASSEWNRVAARLAAVERPNTAALTNEILRVLRALQYDVDEEAEASIRRCILSTLPSGKQQPQAEICCECERSVSGLRKKYKSTAGRYFCEACYSKLLPVR